MSPSKSLTPLLFSLCFGILACQSGASHKEGISHIDSSHKEGASPNESTRVSPPRKIDSSMAGGFSSQSAHRFDSLALDSFFINHRDLSPYAKDVRFFYQGRHYAYAWYDTAGPIEQAGNLYNKIRNLKVEGVNSQLPYTGQLDTLMANTGKGEAPAQLQAELLLTAMYFYFAEKAWTGLDESQTKKMEWFLPRKKTNYTDWLRSWLHSTDTTGNAKEPIYRQYFLLRNYLHKYMTLQQQGDWKQLSVQRRLQLLGDWPDSSATPDPLAANTPGATPSNHPDTTLQRAIRHFQRRLGLPQDGALTKAVLSELNIPLQKRIKQILVNMERSRWLPDTVQGDYLAINIPEFKLHMYRDDSLLWDMNVVVGQSVHKTVIFSGTLKYIVFSPYWNVPPDILKKEVLPGIKKDNNYLAIHHMEFNGGAVRQKPGPWNSLGGVKFLFPNSYNIYLHDTPAKTLFGENDRAFSHGCIRLAEPLKLAAYLLRNDSSWTEEKMKVAMHKSAEKWVTMKDAFRVFIVYFTAFVDRQGNLNFRKDIYGRDRRLEQMILP